MSVLADVVSQAVGVHRGDDPEIDVRDGSTSEDRPRETDARRLVAMHVTDHEGRDRGVRIAQTVRPDRPVLDAEADLSYLGDSGITRRCAHALK